MPQTPIACISSLLPKLLKISTITRLLPYKKSVLWPNLRRKSSIQLCFSTAYKVQQKSLFPLSPSFLQRIRSHTLSSSNTFDSSVARKVSPNIMGIPFANTQKVNRNSLLSRTMSNVTRFGMTRQFSTTARRDMRLVQFVYNADPSRLRVGFMTGNGVVDVNILDSSVPNDMLNVLREGCVCRIFEMYCQQPTYGCIPCSCVTLKAPIYGMDKILCVALNYRDHCSTHKLDEPDVPVIFSKFSSTIIGSTDPILIRTNVAKKVDWEVELCVVIGQTASCVPAEEAMNYITGYTVAQDITARDWTAKEKNMGQLILGKSMDTFCPIGPWITTTDEIQDVNSLRIQCCVNGCLKQDNRTEQMIFKIPFLIERISSVMTLYPGDLILTGTPAGVGQYSDPPQFLQPGDVLTSSVENVGVMSNHVLDFS